MKEIIDRIAFYAIQRLKQVASNLDLDLKFPRSSIPRLSLGDFVEPPTVTIYAPTRCFAAESNLSNSNITLSNPALLESLLLLLSAMTIFLVFAATCGAGYVCLSSNPRSWPVSDNSSKTTVFHHVIVSINKFSSSSFSSTSDPALAAEPSRTFAEQATQAQSVLPPKVRYQILRRSHN